METIQKSAGIFIKDRKILLTRSYNKTRFLSPGGRVEEGETPQEALIREIKEELDLTITLENFDKFAIHEHPASSNPNIKVIVYVFMVKNWQGEPRPSSEVEELKWFSSADIDENVGTVFALEVMPKLKELDLID